MTRREKFERRFDEKRVRVSQNAVTGELEHTIIDDVQKAFERVASVMESEAMKLSISDARRYKDKLAGVLALMYPHCDSDQEPADPKDRLILVLSRRLEDALKR